MSCQEKINMKLNQLLQIKELTLVNQVFNDVEIEDFDINRKEGRIEFHYIRGYKDLISIKPDGSDKKMIKSDGEISIEE